MDLNHSRLVAFGDSITRGTATEETGTNWTELLRRRFRFDLINAGENGNTSVNGMTRLQADVLDRRPDFVLINFGMNDHSMTGENHPRVSPELFEANLRSMAEKVLEAGARPILVTPNYIIEGDGEGYYYSRHRRSFYGPAGGAQEWLDRYAGLVRSVAGSMKIGLVDVRSECEKYDRYDFLISRKNSGSADGVHPHALGKGVYARMIGDFLEHNYG